MPEGEAPAEVGKETGKPKWIEVEPDVRGALAKLISKRGRDYAVGRKCLLFPAVAEEDVNPRATQTIQLLRKVDRLSHPHDVKFEVGMTPLDQKRSLVFFGFQSRMVDTDFWMRRDKLASDANNILEIVGQEKIPSST